MSNYPGNCHCGAFKFTVKLSDLNRVSSCDCSLCYRNAYLWAQPASNSDFAVVQDGVLKEYQHGANNIHKFCSTCGTSIMSCNTSDGEIISVNVRALADIDPDSLATKLKPCGVPDTSLNSVNTSSSQDGLHANCHCGAISYTLHSTPQATKSCNCSICSRDGVLWTYPPIADVTVHAQGSLVEYTFGNKLIVHGFCGVCSVHVWEKFLRPEKAHTIGLNVRAIAGFNFAELPTKVHNGKARMPQYQI
ncbi:Mss4-like protein [Mycena sanguinolenta]|nr:Mss4-like protein [Mycena sanguinolenta]